MATCLKRDDKYTDVAWEFIIVENVVSGLCRAFLKTGLCRKRLGKGLRGTTATEDCHFAEKEAAYHVCLNVKSFLYKTLKKTSRKTSSQAFASERPICLKNLFPMSHCWEFTPFAAVKQYISICIRPKMFGLVNSSQIRIGLVCYLILYIIGLGMKVA